VPKVKRHKVGNSTKFKEKVVDSKGKERTVKGERFTEAEIDDVRLIKIAPMYYFSLDSHKILMIPFSVKFSPEQFIEHTGKQAVNFNKLLKKAKQAEKDFAELEE
jgi:hypothetical protein